MEESVAIFDAETARHDAWFEDPQGRLLFEAKLDAIRLLWRESDRPVLEVGVGTGRFAKALGVGFGIDPAFGALRLARQREVRGARRCRLPMGRSAAC